MRSLFWDAAMNAAVLAAMISAVAALFVSTLSFSLNQRQQRQLDWRKVKLEMYREYVAALSGIIQGRETPEAHLRYADAANSLSLVASSQVLRALYAFLNENSFRNLSRTIERHDVLLTELLSAMRDDLEPREKGRPSNFHFISVPPTANQEIKS